MAPSVLAILSSLPARLGTENRVKDLPCAFQSYTLWSNGISKRPGLRNGGFRGVSQAPTPKAGNPWIQIKIRGLYRIVAFVPKTLPFANLPWLHISHLNVPQH